MKLSLRFLVLTLAGFAAVSAGWAEEPIHGSDHFTFTYRVRLPEMSGKARLWIPLARSDRFQDVKVEGITAPGPHREIVDRSGMNHVLFFAPQSADSGKTMEIRYEVVRWEKTSYTDDLDPRPDLQPDHLVPRNEVFSAAAQAALAKRAATCTCGRALYDFVLGRMKYDKSRPGWGRGDALYASQACAGNCSDFHSYFMALARSVGIPVRFEVGVSIPAERDEGVVNSYHCWIDFRENGRWMPAEISEAAKAPELTEYYFGHQPANRFELSRGRDLEFEPAPASGPINFLIYPLLEVDGTPIKAETEFAFHRLRG